MRNFVFFDTETTGFSKKNEAGIVIQPRIIQLAVSVYYESQTVGLQKIKSKEFLIKPDGWKIPDFDYWLELGYTEDDAEKRSKFWTDNGFSNEKSEAEGVPIIDALNFFKFYHKDADLIVAHNMDFDSKVLGSELKMAGLILPRKQKFCTMKSTVDYCRLPFPKGGNGFKFPKLAELYKILFDKEFEGAHQAISDTDGCAKCYFELLKRGLI